MTAVIEKKRIAESFSKAAATYDSVAELQREIGGELMERLPQTLAAGSTLCDLGSGTGYFTEQLAGRAFTAGAENNALVALDLAHGMLTHARMSRALPSVSWLCGDAEQLPLADASIDLVFSSLAIQWCNNYPALFAEIERVLKPGGTAYIATLGPDTLSELRHAWQCVDNFVHVNQFVSLATLKAALNEIPSLSLLEASVANKVLEYQELKQLTHELKALGAHNMNDGQSKGLTAPQRLKAFKRAYEAKRMSSGKLPATYEVYYLVVRKA